MAERGAWLCFPGRGRSDAASAQSPYLGSAWVYPAGRGVGQGIGPGLGRWTGVCAARRRSRLIYRILTHRGRKGERRSFAETDYAALLDAVHQQLAAPIVLIWDNLNTHISAAMRELIAARDWLHVIRLPASAPDLNPDEHVWSHVKRGLGNLIVHGVDQFAAVVKNRLKRIQYRPELIDAFVAHTGMELDPAPP